MRFQTRTTYARIDTTRYRRLPAPPGLTVRALWLAAGGLCPARLESDCFGPAAAARPGQPPRSLPADRCAAVWLAACPHRATAFRAALPPLPQHAQSAVSCSGPNRSIAQWRESSPPPTTGRITVIGIHNSHLPVRHPESLIEDIGWHTCPLQCNPGWVNDLEKWVKVSENGG